MESDTLTEEELLVYNYVYHINEEKNIMETYANVLSHPLFVGITDEDTVILKTKFDECVFPEQIYPGFMFVKIDTFTSMVYVDYYNKSTFERLFKAT